VSAGARARYPDLAGLSVFVSGGGSGIGAAIVACFARAGCRVAFVDVDDSASAALVERLQPPDGTATVRYARCDVRDIPALRRAIADADAVIGAVLEPGKLSPKLVSRAALRAMRPGSAVVDVGIDQGGIFETSRMTTLSQPTYVEERIVHYAVPNMPTLVARTATFALAAATFPFVRALADAGISAALDADPGLAAGVMVWDGSIAHAGLAADAATRSVPRPWRTAPAPGARIA